MRTINQTPGTENQIVWLIRINMDDGTYVYFADSPITLSGVTFSGSIISYGSMSDFGSDTDVLLGGGLGSMDHFNFAISRYTVYNDGTNTLQAFFNDWYPATGKPVLTSKEVDLGIVWNTGSATLSNVTWLKNYRVSDYSYNTGNAFINCIEPDELSGVQVPRHKLQDENDNGISYYPEITEETKGLIIPVIYGDGLTSYSMFYNSGSPFPTIQIGELKKYIVSSHICYNVSGSYVYTIAKFINSVKRFSLLYNGGATTSNTRSGVLLSFNPTVGDDLLQIIYIKPNHLSGGTDANYAIDDSDTTYMLLDASNSASWRMESEIPESEFGQFINDAFINDRLKITIEWQAVTGSSSVDVDFYDLLGNTFSGIKTESSSGGWTETTFAFGSFIPSGQVISIEFLDQLTLLITNGANQIRIRNIYFTYTDLIVCRIQKNYRRENVSNRDLRTGDRNTVYYKTQVGFEVAESPICLAIKGYGYDNWID